MLKLNSKAVLKGRGFKPKIFDEAIRAGYRLIDTAAAYQNEEEET
jgi:diketogulonate reductase-like aldo/keto reductase